MQIIRWPLDLARNLKHYRNLPAVAKAERAKDNAGLTLTDPGAERAATEAIDWLCRAQDNSSSNDGGVARDYSLINGWNSSYPETTGYIIPTILEWAQRSNDSQLRERARKMLDWLVGIQFPEGGFQGGVIGANPVVPVTFNTGQILLGLVAAVQHFGDDYREPMTRAADWLVQTQDEDGCWRKNPSPFAAPGEKVYETHVAWGLFEAARVTGKQEYAVSALANVRWALSYQLVNGWFDNCCLSDANQPLTHTLGYVLRGVMEAYLFTQDEALLKACRKTADGLISAVKPNGFLPGRLDSKWRGTVNWACLTGSVQIAYCWLTLFRETQDTRYREAALAANRYVRRTINVDGTPETRGAVKGAFPIQGGYCTYEFPNWASKFFIDSNVLELDLSE